MGSFFAAGALAEPERQPEPGSIRTITGALLPCTCSARPCALCRLTMPALTIAASATAKSNTRAEEVEACAAPTPAATQAPAPTAAPAATSAPAATQAPAATAVLGALAAGVRRDDEDMA